MLNVDALLLLQRSDVAHVAAERERFDGLKLVLFDHGLLDEALANGLTNVEFRRLAIDPDHQGRAFTEALARATLVDLQLGALRRELFDGTVFDGWDVGPFHHALLRLLLARQIGAACEQGFPEKRIGLLRPLNAQQQYFDAAIVTDLVARDPARWAVVGGYGPARGFNAQAYQFAFDTPGIAAAMAAQPASAITHLPSCFYDRARIDEELARIHPVSIDLPSLLWDVAVRRRGTPLLRPLDTLPPPAPACDIYAERAMARLADLLGDLLPQPASRTLQLDSWRQRCRLQAINYTGLRAALKGHAPRFLLADHDVGNNGVLFSVADALGSAITVLPHSAYPAMVLPHARRVTAVERAGFNTPARTVLGQPVPVRAVRWTSPQPPAEAPRVRSVCLLLNAAHTDGLSLGDLLALVAFYKPLAALCNSADVELLLRPKPGSPALNVIAGAFGIAPSLLQQQIALPLDEVARRTQICIAYGEPTTGVMSFIEAGAYTINANEAAWPLDLVACPPPVADGTVPTLRLNDALQAVQRLIAEPEQFRARRRLQAEALARRSADAHEHFFPQPIDPPIPGA